MRQTNTKLLAEQKPLGVIDVISAGLDLVRRRPWTLLVPILFDLLIWLLPRLSLSALFRPYANEMFNVTALSADPQAAEETRQALQTLIESFNLLSLVTTTLNAVTRLPSLFAVDAASVPGPVTAWANPIPIESPELMLVLFVPLFLLGLAATALYLEWIAQGVRPLAQEPRGASLVRAARLWLRLILFALLLLGLATAAGLVLMMFQVALNNPELTALLTLLLTVGLLWVFIYFFFVPSAMAVSGVGVRQALRRSTLLFRVFFWATLALVALSLFLDRGLAIIWDGLTVSTVGVVIGIIANAFIGTALIAASMVYYQDRLGVIERLRQKQQRARK